jgi:hypothetical protein
MEKYVGQEVELVETDQKTSGRDDARDPPVRERRGPVYRSADRISVGHRARRVSRG